MRTALSTVITSRVRAMQVTAWRSPSEHFRILFRFCTVTEKSMEHSVKGKSWTHEELLIVCNLYVTLPFGQMHARNPIVVRLARALGRTSGSVAMKLVN